MYITYIYDLEKNFDFGSSLHEQGALNISLKSFLGNRPLVAGVTVRFGHTVF